MFRYFGGWKRGGGGGGHSCTPTTPLAPCQPFQQGSWIRGNYSRLKWDQIGPDWSNVKYFNLPALPKLNLAKLGEGSVFILVAKYKCKYREDLKKTF